MSPSDVADEREIVVKVAQSLNKTIGEVFGWCCSRCAGRTSPDVGWRAQEITNRKYLDRPVPIYLGIMWKRVGSPSGGFDESGAPFASGTIEEFQRALRFKRESGNGWPRMLSIDEPTRI